MYLFLELASIYLQQENVSNRRQVLYTNIAYIHVTVFHKKGDTIGVYLWCYLCQILTNFRNPSSADSLVHLQ